MFSPQTILVPTDFSPQAAAAFEFAVALAKPNRARLLLLHIDPLPLFHGEVIDRRQPEYQQRLRDAITALKPSDPAVEVERLLAEGVPADEIIAFAKERNCDLIVMGTHGRTGLERVLMGSVAERVVRTAPCPVLTVKLPSKGELLGA